MATTEAVIDSDLFIDHFRVGKPFGITRGWYSSVTRAELYSGKRVDEEKLELVLGLFDEVEVTKEIATHAGRIRRLHNVALPDALIAATALSLGVPVATRNRKHFESIRGLKLAKI